MNLVPTGLRLGMGLSVIVAAGLPLTWWLLPKRQGKGFIFEAAALSFGIGIGLTTLAMLFVSLGGGTLSLPNILVACFIVVGALTALLAALVRARILPLRFDRATSTRIERPPLRPSAASLVWRSCCFDHCFRNVFCLFASTGLPYAGARSAFRLGAQGQNLFHSGPDHL